MKSGQSFSVRISNMNSRGWLGTQISCNLVTRLGIGLKYFHLISQALKNPLWDFNFFFTFYNRFRKRSKLQHKKPTNFFLSHKITAAFGEILESRDRTVVTILQPLFSAAQLGTMHLDKVEESCLLTSIIPFSGMVKEEKILFLGKLSSGKESIKTTA